MTKQPKPQTQGEISAKVVAEAMRDNAKKAGDFADAFDNLHRALSDVRFFLAELKPMIGPHVHRYKHEDSVIVSIDKKLSAIDAVLKQ